MMCFRWLFSLFVGMLLTACATAAAGIDELPIDESVGHALAREAGRGFEIRRTPHFIIAYNTPDDVLDALIKRIEATYASIQRFCEFNNIRIQPLDHRLEIIFYNRRPQYDRYTRSIGFVGEGTYGVYNQDSNRSAFVNMYNDPVLVELQRTVRDYEANLDRLVRQMERLAARGGGILTLHTADGRRETGTKEELEQRLIEPAREVLAEVDARRESYSERINLTVVQHEVTHQVLFNLGVHAPGGANPKWLVEGLATQFETPPNRRGAGIGKPNQIRLRDLRMVLGEGDDRQLINGDDFVRAFDAGRLVALPELLTDPGLFRARGKEGTDLYAVSWALVHYLQRRRSDEFADYIEAIRRRPANARPSPQEELELFEKHFGPPDDAFLRQWGNFITRLVYRPPDAEF